MRINVTNDARKLYGQFCPVSTYKCSSLDELDYKIQRLVDLGDKCNVDDNHTLVYYHYLEIEVFNNEIVNIRKLEDKSMYYHIPEFKKIMHKDDWIYERKQKIHELVI